MPSGIDRNVMLYWDDVGELPSDIGVIREQWRHFCPGWNIKLFNIETARLFLRERYGEDIVRLFSTCALKAMRADFFRVFWAISEGGIYSDVRFVPKRKPLFFDPSKDLTVGRKPDGLIRNNTFFAKKDCNELKLIGYEIIKSISERKIPFVNEATGPVLWTRVLPEIDTSTLSIIDWRKDMLSFIEFSDYPSCTRDTDMHWLELQRRMIIYQDPAESPKG